MSTYIYDELLSIIFTIINIYLIYLLMYLFIQFVYVFIWFIYFFIYLVGITRILTAHKLCDDMLVVFTIETGCQVYTP